MSSELTLQHEVGRFVEIRTGSGQPLWRYVYLSENPANESPRPYAHPVYSAAGDLLTNFRPNDHPWHHALSLTLTSVGGVNFWGGPSYHAADGYQWRDNHGCQEHVRWHTVSPQRLDQELAWQTTPNSSPGSTLLQERRVLETHLSETAGWSLEWRSELRNVSGRELILANYHAAEGLAGSHYTGLQFRGTRDLLDEHGDASIGISAEGGLVGEAAIHGVSARWIQWSCQHDASLRRTRIRFENLGGPLPWFVRAKSPITAFAFHREAPHPLGVDDVLTLHHRLTFTPA